MEHTTEQIELIGKFMEWHCHKDAPPFTNEDWDTPIWHEHVKWDWLMIVHFKIQKLHKELWAKRNEFEAKYYDEFMTHVNSINAFIGFDEDESKEKLLKSVVGFIEWHIGNTSE